ncbi:Na+/H+ antiporter NhaC [Clostridium ihumii]|uniref:Na+/H+ antiporter NhaC n=1 Tax=Clostridium ihumii TaxID=1470356 RepID=UPI00058E642E|nr:Na+/H+ antiporter NhaC [Clostridium ihumii]
MNNNPKPKVWEALVPILILIVTLGCAIILFDASPHIPLVIGAAAAALMAIKVGFKWSDLEKGIVKTINLSLEAIIILMIIGIVIASWIASGTVPTLIYYGLKILSPSIFLVATCIICSIVSVCTGSSWTTAGTVGVALMGVGSGLGINPSMTAGAIISGAYFGDKMSPLSDTTNLAPAVAGSNLFDHIKHMVYTTGPSLIISLILFGILGAGFSGKALDVSQIDLITKGLEDNFNLSLLTLIPPIVVLIMVSKKLPATPVLLLGSLLGCILGVFLQGIAPGEFFSILNDGFVINSGVPMIDKLLSRGGLQSMMSTVALIFCAMSFGGIMEYAGFLNILAEKILKLAVNTGSLVLITVVSCITLNFLTGDHYLSILIGGRMYKDEFEKRNLAPKNLSRILEDAGTITSPFVPWSTCGAFMSKTLGVANFAFLPFCFLNLINPIISIIYGFTGITMAKIDEDKPIGKNLSM